MVPETFSVNIRKCANCRKEISEKFIAMFRKFERNFESIFKKKISRYKTGNKNMFHVPL